MWSAEPNDLIGGWIVTNSGKPASETNPSENYIIAECYSKEDAAVIARLLNIQGVKRSTKRNNAT